MGIRRKRKGLGSKRLSHADYEAVHRRLLIERLAILPDHFRPPRLMCGSWSSTTMDCTSSWFGNPHTAGSRICLPISASTATERWALRNSTNSRTPPVQPIVRLAGGMFFDLSLGQHQRPQFTDHGNSNRTPSTVASQPGLLGRAAELSGSPFRQCLPRTRQRHQGRTGRRIHLRQQAGILADGIHAAQETSGRRIYA